MPATKGKLPRMMMLMLGAVSICCSDEAPDSQPAAREREVVPCTQGIGSKLLQNLGMLEGATYWECRPPRATDSRASFAQAEGNTSLVSGGSTTLALAWQGAPEIQGRNLIVAVKGESGYYIVQAPDNAQPMPAEIYISPDAPDGVMTLSIAIDDGTGTPAAPKPGPYLDIELHIVHVGSGDIQVNLNWDQPNDLDLHVMEPSGEEIYYAHSKSATEGELDLDSNPGCSIDGINNENVFWPEGKAPHGFYVVSVHVYAYCGVNGPTNYRVNIIRAGIPESYEGTLEPEQNGMAVQIARFSW